MDLKPIETQYNGYKFRSRLEARWAVFFDTVGINYEYEKEGFDLGEAGWYLPDFWLPDLHRWIEIKSSDKLSKEESIKLLKFHKLINHDAERDESFCVLMGEPYHKKYKVCYRVVDAWGVCPLCGRTDLMIDHGICDTNAMAYCVWCDIIERNVTDNENGYFHKGVVVEKHGYSIFKNNKLLKAYNTARSARFEHGENPAKFKSEIRNPTVKEKTMSIFVDEYNKAKVKPVCTPVVIKYDLEKEKAERKERFKNCEVKGEIDIVRVITEEGYQISQTAVNQILSNENKKELIEYVLDNIDFGVFVIECEHIDVDGFNKSLN